MKTKLMSTDLALISLWSVLLLNASKINDDLLFGWPIQVHLSLIGALIAFKILFKKSVIRAV